MMNGYPWYFIVLVSPLIPFYLFYVQMSIAATFLLFFSVYFGVAWASRAIGVFFLTRKRFRSAYLSYYVLTLIVSAGQWVVMNPDDILGMVFWLLPIGTSMYWLMFRDYKKIPADYDWSSQ
jgi:hypothetical protein